MLPPASGIDIAALRRLVSEHDLEAFFEKAAKAAAEMVSANGMALLEIVSDDLAHYRFIRGLPDEHQKRVEDLQFPYRATTVETAILSGSPVFTANYPQLPSAKPQFVDAGVKSVLVIPCGPRGKCHAILAIAWLAHFPSQPPAPPILDALMLIADLMHAALYRQSLEDNLARQAQHDALTGLPNRRYLTSYFLNTLRPIVSETMDAAVALLDLDNFKQVNDQHGHVVGDALLCKLAKRLECFLEGSDMAARLGGDEFVLVLSRDLRCCKWEDVFEGLSVALNAPYQFEDGTVLDCHASIGTTWHIDPASALETCLRNADHALYLLKRNKKTRLKSWQLFEAPNTINASPPP